MDITVVVRRWRLMVRAWPDAHGLGFGHGDGAGYWPVGRPGVLYGPRLLRLLVRGYLDSCAAPRSCAHLFDLLWNPGGGHPVSNFVAAVISLGAFAGATSARLSVAHQLIPKGQTDASMALG